MMGSGDDCNYIRGEASRVQCNGGDHYGYRSKLEDPAKARSWEAAKILGFLHMLILGHWIWMSSVTWWEYFYGVIRKNEWAR